ncbi:MAG: RluA family pseudouridine synthase [Verrucomicrobiae bacterium]|nr:RluA family pseudouridine synthase [Verrucomicrobiae bacterium]
MSRASVPVVFEDEAVLVVDKPAGLVCHSASRPEHDSLAQWLRRYGVETPRLVHRLDRETSGLVLVAKNMPVARVLARQMHQRQIQREYLAIVWGEPSFHRMVVDQPIGLADHALVYTRRVVRPDGQPARTTIEVAERLCGFTVVRLRPHTGRAHQLRVHMQWLGHPIVGDKIYGPDERWYLEFIRNGVTPEMLEQLLLPRQALHASRLTFCHPVRQQPITLEAPPPADLSAFIAAHRQARAPVSPVC